VRHKQNSEGGSNLLKNALLKKGSLAKCLMGDFTRLHKRIDIKVLTRSSTENKFEDEADGGVRGPVGEEGKL